MNTGSLRGYKGLKMEAWQHFRWVAGARDFFCDAHVLHVTRQDMRPHPTSASKELAGKLS